MIILIKFKNIKKNKKNLKKYQKKRKKDYLLIISP